ncbi:MAG: TetR/AcrR family transcriptional regulator [Proteobacteria bacterium]|nr:TetR/AcrR family transcriptional regulator [Pseudomonadota bacterium]
MLLTDIPLRERKAGQMRVALVRALLARLVERPLAEIPVREICAEVGVSEPTFFNHFDGKSAALPYFVSLWSLGTAEAMGEAEDGVHRLFIFFDQVGKAMQSHPGVLNAIIGHHQQLRIPPPATIIPRADRLVWYGDGSATVEDEPQTVPALIASCVAEMHRDGALPEGLVPARLRDVLLALFYGIPAVVPAGPHVRSTFRGAARAVLVGHGVRFVAEDAS